MGRLAEIHRLSRKPRDILWNRFVARPLASLLLVGLERTPVTPNQITFAATIVFATSAALGLWRLDHTGLLLFAAVLEFSYVLDCADGQLARVRGTSTPVGAHLDFLMDELKAFVLVAACAMRLYRQSSDPRWLVEGLLALGAVASAISLTTFVRRPEYAAATGDRVQHGAGDYGQGFEAAPPLAARSPLRTALGMIEGAGRFVIHYPSHFVFVAFLDRLDWFLHAYLAVNAAQAARLFFATARKLGRPDGPAAAPAPPPEARP